jgi:hypothetical protein
LRRQGELILISRSEDFAFAPLLEGGDVHLLKRALNPAWFDTVRQEYRWADFLVISARRKSGL